MNENSHSDDTEMKDDEPKTEKNNYMGNKIEKYYMKFADSELVQSINSVNQFKLFDSFLKELENEKPLLYSNIMSTIFTESRIKVLNKFRLLQKVPIINKIIAKIKVEVISKSKEYKKSPTLYIVTCT